MAANKEAPAARPLCSYCARMLKDGGFRLTYKKDAYLHMENCSYCGKYLPVHDFTVRGGRRRKNKV